MIIVFFGQPHSGKSTLSKVFKFKLSNFGYARVNTLDGDEIRAVFSNSDYSRAGRINNLNKISDIAAVLAYKGEAVIISAAYPYKEAREYLESLYSGKIIWVYLTYSGLRGREPFHISDFEMPSGKEDNVFFHDTTNKNVEHSARLVFDIFKKVY